MKIPFKFATLVGIALMSASVLTGCFEKEKTIAGTVDLHPGLKDKIGPDAALYVVARQAGQKSGPPVAVRRFGQPLQFPIEFQLLKQDLMTPEQPFEGELTLTARIAQQGAATPVGLGDLEGQSQPATLKVGSASPVRILIDHPATIQN